MTSTYPLSLQQQDVFIIHLEKKAAVWFPEFHLQEYRNKVKDENKMMSGLKTDDKRNGIQTRTLSTGEGASREGSNEQGKSHPKSDSRSSS